MRHRLDGDDCMPVVGSPDEHSVNIIAGGDIAEVTVGLAVGVAVVFIDPVLCHVAVR